MQRLLLLPVLFLTMQTLAQSLNADLETWTTATNSFVIDTTLFGFAVNVSETVNYVTPADWTTVNQLTQSNTAGNEQLVFEETGTVFSGSSAARIESREITLSVDVGPPIGVQSFTNIGPGLLVSGFFTLEENEILGGVLSNDFSFLNPFTYPGVGQPNTEAAKSLVGHYQYTGVSGDSALVVSGLLRNDTIIAYAETRLPNAATWTRFEVDYTYVYPPCQDPDTVVTLFCSSNLDLTFADGEFSLNSTYTGEDGSVLLVDSTGLVPFPGGTPPPVAVDDAFTVLSGDSVDLDVLDNDVYCPGGITLTILSGPSVGTISGSLPDVRYLSTPGFVGNDTIEYELCTSGQCDTAEAVIDVNAVPPCIAIDDVFSPIPANQTTLLPVLDNDSDCGMMPEIVTPPSFGVTTVIAGTGEVSYSPNTDYVGADQFSYRVCSSLNTAQCDTAQVSIDIVLGVGDLDPALFAVHPNPARDVVMVSTDLPGVKTVQLIDLSGRLVRAAEMRSEVRLSVADLAPGLYRLELTTADGRGVRTVAIDR